MKKLLLAGCAMVMAAGVCASAQALPSVGPSVDKVAQGTSAPLVQKAYWWHGRWYGEGRDWRWRRWGGWRRWYR